MVASKRDRRFCYRRNFDFSKCWFNLHIEVNMIRITYGEGGYDETKPDNNIVLIEDLPDPPELDTD